MFANITTLCSFDIRRYCPKVSEDARWVRERSHEAYAKNYAMVFLHDEPLAGRNMKKVSDCFLDQTSKGSIVGKITASRFRTADTDLKI